MTAILAAQTDGSRPDLDVGAVLGAMWRVLARRGLDLLVVGAPFVILPQVIAGFLPQNLEAVKLALGLPGVVFTGGASLIAYAELSGGSITSWKAIGGGLGRFGTLWAVGVLSGLAIGLGTILLVVPGLIAMIGWIPASATVMVENTGSTEALGRAWRRTQGVRWRLALLSLLVFVAVLLGFVVVLIADLAVMSTAGEAAMNQVSNLVVAPLYAFVVVALMTAFSTAVYAALRPAGAPAVVADVFA
ncbi:MAG TPA: hypothetical protein VGL58_00990 [Caulobacteraceae bacterium]|jgi:hypothetical protein